MTALENRDQIETGGPHHAGTPQTGGADSLDNLAELIERAKKGDHQSLNRLLARMRPRLYAVALRIVHDGDDAEDVAQEALLKVCRCLTRFEERAAFTTWLHRIVVNTSLDRLRQRHGRHQRVVEDDGGEAPRAAPAESIDEETPERVYARAETSAGVQSALARLSSVHREVIALRELDGESYQGIAAIVRCPVGTVMSRLHHARHRLAIELAPSFGAQAMRAA
jgi:RNA polymerase sigma-70 factor (ECF subfamily)